jgi:hypothetical protein
MRVLLVVADWHRSQLPLYDDLLKHVDLELAKPEHRGRS